MPVWGPAITVPFAPRRSVAIRPASVVGLERTFRFAVVATVSPRAIVDAGVVGVVGVVGGVEEEVDVGVTGAVPPPIVIVSCFVTVLPEASRASKVKVLCPAFLGVPMRSPVL